ncbi:rhomboid domain-containing protein 2-like [Styela clava]|uniref:rhomboid domain-containing protein 2-like n=1 Tax=Styela clava TaxID=7725 RepID=UPI001939544A|nr:rhomboid domain-containing protein 2-like [Styela clava]
MIKLKSLGEKLRWYLTNLPVVTTVLFVAIIVCYKIKLARHFTDVILCVQPHMIMTGQVSRLIKYVIHHKNVKNLLLSLASLAIFGTVAERQAGSIRYLFLMTIFAILSASLTVFFSILLGFSSHYSSLMYSCPALGLTPALFGIIVLVFKNSPMKKSVILFVMLPNVAIPWLLLISSQVILQDTTFISNLSGCIVGSLYVCSLRGIITLPSVLVKYVDNIFKKIFKYIPIVKYIPGSSPMLPQYHLEKDQPELNGIQHQPFRVPDDCPVPISEDSVPKYKVDKLLEMGFSKEESVVALTAANNNVDQAVSILTNKQIGSQATVLQMKGN